MHAGGHIRGLGKAKGIIELLKQDCHCGCVLLDRYCAQVEAEISRPV